jgi:hypothetical protein
MADKFDKDGGDNSEEDSIPQLVNEINETHKNNSPECDKVNCNGIDHNTYKTLKFYEQTTLALCEFCNKIFNKSMMAKEYTLDGNHSERICFHCLFNLNYNLEMRSQVDGIYGKTIVEYIMECKDFHNQEMCQMKTLSGGCFICDFLNQIPIDGILDAELLGIYEEEKIDDSVILNDEVISIAI